MRRSRSDYVIQTVSNAFRLLEAFQDEEILGVTELSRRLELHKNNVFRLLATLQQLGYIEQCDDDRYRLGIGCVELGHSFTQTRTLTSHARPTLERLVKATGETAHVGVLDGGGVAHLDGVEPDQLLVTRSRVGSRLPNHCTALGKALLGCGDPVRLADLALRLEQENLQPETPATITDREKFIEHLRAVAHQGFALDLEECEPGLCCVAAPVRDASDEVIAALSISAPAQRASEEVLLDRAVPRVVAAAEALSRELGWTG